VKAKWVPVAAHASLFVLLVVSGAHPVALYLYFVSLFLMATGINFERVGLIYLSGAAAIIALIPFVVYRPQMPIVVLMYVCMALATIELSLESIGVGYLAVEWKDKGMRRWMVLGHVALLGFMFIVSAFLVQTFFFFQLVTNDMFLLLVLALLSMAGVAFYIRLSAKVAAE
jgi:hypothetical protein